MVPEEKKYGCGSIRIGLDIWGCDPTKLTDPALWDTELRRLVTKRKLGARKTFVDPYDGEGGGSGFELILTLEDSFIVVETWPKGKPNISPRPYVKIVLDFCNHSGDHTEDAHWVAKRLQTFVYQKGMQVNIQRTQHGP